MIERDSPVGETWYFYVLLRRVAKLGRLALAQHGLGQNNAAREWFTKADQWLDATNKQLAKAPVGTAPPHNYFWLEIQLLHREAKKLIP